MSITEIKQEPNRTEKKELRYDFDEKEIVELARKQGFKHKDLDVVEAEKKMSASQFKGRIEILEGEIEACTDKIMAGFEMRMIEVGVFYHTPKQGYKTSVRLDTGETVDEDRMSQAECQSHLPLEEVEEPEAEEAKALPDHGWTLMDNEKPGAESVVMFRDKHSHEWMGWIVNDKDAEGWDCITDDDGETVGVSAAIAWRTLNGDETAERAESKEVQVKVGWTTAKDRLPDSEVAVVIFTFEDEEFTGSIQADEGEEEVFISDSGEEIALENISKWRDLTDAETTEREG